MALARNYSRCQRHTPIAEAALSGWLYPRRQHPPFVKARAGGIQIYIIKGNWIQAWDRFGWCQAGAGKIKIYQEQRNLIQGLIYILLASGRFSIHQKR